MEEKINTHGMIVDFGRYKGKLYTRIPVSYLKWMVHSCHHHSDVARSEMERRGTVTPTIEISGHAIDSASLRFGKLWRETAKNDNEGLHAWLVRMCEEALTQSKINEEGIVYYGTMKLVFEPGEWPVLKTVTPYKTSKETIEDIKAKIIIRNGRHEFIKPGKRNELSE
jgi:hypothetical protein